MTTGRHPAKETGQGRTTDHRPLGQQTHGCIFVELQESIKARLLLGEIVQAGEYPEKDRPHFHGAIAMLRDHLPIRVRWRTKTESVLGDWKLRQRCYVLVPEATTQPQKG